MRLPFTVAASCFLIAGAASAQLTGPTSGFIFHQPSKTIRPIVGVPGSAYLGPALVDGFENAAISPLGTSALATAQGALYLLRGFDKGQPSALPVDGAIGAVSRIAWSRDGAGAAVYSADSRQAQIIRNLDTTSTPESPLDLSGVEGDVSTFAFDGKRLVVGAAGLYLADPSGPSLLMRDITPAAVAFAGADLYVADQGRNQVWTFAAYAGAATPMLFADERSGLSAPAALGVTADGRQLLIASAGARSVDVFDIATRAASRHIDLDFAPSRMDSIGAGRLKLLNSGSSTEPLYLIDTAIDLNVYFIPDGREQ